MCTRPISVPNPNKNGLHDYIVVACGQCLECKRKRANDYVIRGLIEASLHEQNCVLTLTYANTDGNLCRRDFQLFMKRLRKSHNDIKIRFLGCGEYGSHTLRPHFHAVIFGYCPCDLEYFFTRDGQEFYKSKEVAKLWRLGNILVGKVNPRSLRYSILYFNKNPFKDLPENLTKPFFMCSTSPGIGCIKKDVLPISSLSIENDALYYDGRRYLLPRYYMRVLERVGYDVESLKDSRKDLYIKQALMKPRVNSFEEFDNSLKKEQEFYGIYGNSLYSDEFL